MKIIFAFLATMASCVAHAHSCESDAIDKADSLLRLHFEGVVGTPIEIDKSAKALTPIKVLTGEGKLDVLEVWGHVYKADYRMHFIYAQIPGSCVLMGQEILEAGNPY